MKDTLAKRAMQQATVLEHNRQDWDRAWQEVASYMAPTRSHYGGRYGVQESYAAASSNDGKARSGPRILDATAVRAVRILASGMQSGLTSPARPWFRLRSSGEASIESGPVRRWLDSVENTIYNALARSNFYQAIHGLYTELAVFGSADLFMEADAERHMRFTCLTAGEFAWSCNASGRVDTVLRRISMTALQVAELYGAQSLSRQAQSLLAKNPEAELELYHLIQPRAERNPQRLDKLNMPYSSLVWEANTRAESLLHHGGYEENPHLCARWDVVGTEVYGRSPGMDVLPDIKLLQEMTRSQILALHKVVNPPMRVPAAFKQRLSLIPGAINYVSNGQAEAVGPLYQINPDIGAVSRKIEDIRTAVREGLFNTLFLMFAGDSRSGVTAAEVMERGQEKLLMLGPVIDRHQTEILDPLLSRAFGILHRSGAIPPAPPELEGQELKIEYVSALAQAQKQGAGQAIRQLSAEVASLMSFVPDVQDKLDFEQIIDELASIIGVPSKLIRSDAEVKALREAREAATAKPTQGLEAALLAAGENMGLGSMEENSTVQAMQTKAGA